MTHAGDPTGQEGKGPLLKYEGIMADRRIGGTDRESYVGVLSGRAERNVVKYLNVFKAHFYPLLVYEWVLSSTTVSYSILGVIGVNVSPG